MIRDNHCGIYYEISTIAIERERATNSQPEYQTVLSKNHRQETPPAGRQPGTPADRPSHWYI